MKIVGKEELQEMRSVRDEAERKIDEIKSTSGSAWKDMRDGITKAWDNLEEGFARASKRFH